MTKPTPPTVTMNTGPKPMTMEDVFRIMGQYVMEIEALRRQVLHLQEQLAQHRVTEE